MWDYDEYWGGELDKMGYLGEPQTKACRLSFGVYRGDFQNGIVLVNPTDRVVRVPLGGIFQRIKGIRNQKGNDGSRCHTVDLPSLDGIILLRIHEAIDE